MSLNRRRWSNELLDSLMDFQSREGSELVDSLDNKIKQNVEISVDSLDKSLDITSMLASLNLQNTPKISESSQNFSKSSTTAAANISDESETERLSSDIMNLCVSEDFTVFDEKKNRSSIENEILNKSMIEDKDLNKCVNPTPAQFDHLFNLNERLTENITLSSDSGTIKLSSCGSSNQNTFEIQTLDNQFTQYLRMSQETNQLSNISLNERIIERTTSSTDSGTIKLSSCNSSTTNTINTQTIESQDSQFFTRKSEDTNQLDIANLDERIICLDNETIKLSNDSDTQNNLQTNIEEKVPDHQPKISNEDIDQINQIFFSSPFEFSKTAEEMIAEMNEPDIWDALLALEEALSPLEDHVQNSEEQPKDCPHVLSRLSQKFKETPTRFTEKLVSILEDSVVSESPTKEMHDNDVANTSGISLHRMTGEFRKLCKFIEDESMPEWAPSMMTTYLEKTETPENEKIENVHTKTPKTMFRHFNNSPLETPKTPLNKIRLNTDTPIKQFTPSADKSFEYWEKVCNIICENQSNSKKKARNSLCVRESSKHLNEILSICERQLASLDDSTIEIRTSEPCKKTDSELKLQVLQMPRSKSECKINFNTNEKMYQSSNKKYIEILNEKSFSNDDVQFLNENKSNVCDKVNKKLIFDDDDSLSDNSDCTIKEHIIKDDAQLMNDKYIIKKTHVFENENFKTNIEESFEDNYNLKSYDQNNKQEGYSISSPYNSDDPDCSLLIELAKRRQRCLDTAKLMMEIDKEDPISNKDNKCLETLYKLGIQDKTVTDIEEDTKFLNTLNECLEYKKYFREKSKPLMNVLQKFDSPDDLKKKTSSIMKSKKIVTNQPKSLNIAAKNTKTSVLSKPRTEPKRSLKSVQNRRMTPKVVPKSLSLTSKPVKKASSSPNLQPTKFTPKVSSKPVIKLSPEAGKKNLQLQKKITPKSTPMSLSKSPHSEQKCVQQKKITPKSTLKVNPQSDLKKNTPKIFNSKNRLTPDGVNRVTENFNKNSPASPISPVLRERHENVRSNSSPKLKLFVTPGKSPHDVTLGRKKPSSYFSDIRRPTPQEKKITYDSVKSPLSLFIHGTDTNLITNVQSRINDRLLTPVSNVGGKSPKLKFNLSSKENKSPTANENIVLPTVRYQSAKKVRMIDDKTSYSPSSITPNSVMKKLLAPVENTVVIRHEGRVVEYNPKTNHPDSETSVRVQKMAEKTSSLRRKFV